MNINNLISKYGENAQLNNVSISAFIDEEKISFYKKAFKEFSGLKMCAVLVKEAVSDTDVFLINNSQYRVFESKEIRKNKIRIYSDALLFKDDFTNDIEILKQSLNRNGCNLPSIKASEKIIFKGRIKTIRNSEHLQYASYSDKTPTHSIDVLFNDSVIEITDLIKYKDRSFEILGFENINEQNRILAITVIEILNV